MFACLSVNGSKNPFFACLLACLSACLSVPFFFYLISSCRCDRYLLAHIAANEGNGFFFWETEREVAMFILLDTASIGRSFDVVVNEKKKRYKENLSSVN